MEIHHNAFFGQLLTHSMHSIHSVPFFLFLELSVTSTPIGHTLLHFPHETHFSLSHVTRITEKWLMGFRNTVMGQIYLQKNGVNLKQIGSIMTHAARITYLRYLNALSPLKRFFLKGNGIRLISSCIIPKGHKNPHTALPRQAAKNNNSPTT